MPSYAFSEIRSRLDDWRVFNNMVDSPHYRDAVYQKFSDGEYQRRYEAIRSVIFFLITAHGSSLRPHIQ